MCEVHAASTVSLIVPHSVVLCISVLEVLQFGRDAYVAESWLAGQEPLVRAAELGTNVDEVESLIKRHEAFEKLAAAWEDRFVLLEKLTTVNRANLNHSIFCICEKFRQHC